MSQASEKIIKIPKVYASIENIYNLCYPLEIPSHLSLENQIETLKNQGILPRFMSEIGLFEIRINNFQGFIEDLKKGLITTNLMSILSINIYNDMIEQAKELRKFNSEPLNRADCVLSRIVLEDGLKKICSKYGITLESDKANEANTELKKNTIYGITQFKQVDT